MVKKAVLVDTHFGVRSDDLQFHANMKKFFDNIFFPEIDKRGIKEIIHGGDVFDSRKKINVLSARLAREYFFDPFSNRNMEMDVIAGNHDLYFRHESHTSALNEFLEDQYNVNVFTEVVQKDDILYVPWIHKNNRESSIEAIQKSSARVVFGHLELIGFQLLAGQKSRHGEDSKLFEKFEHVYSGHFHHKHTQGNVTYLGSPSQHTWADVDDIRGFHIFDTETHEMEFIPNPYNIYCKVKYGEEVDVLEKHVRVYYDEISSQSEFDKYIKKLEKDAYSVNAIATQKYRKVEGSVDKENIEIDDTLSIISNAVNDVDVQNYLTDLYNKAIHLV